MSTRCFLICAVVFLLFANGANAARYQRTTDGKTLVWNSLRGVAQEVTWSGLRDLNGYAAGEGTLTWYRMGRVVNSYTGKMVHGKFEGVVIRDQGQTRLQTKFVDGEKVGGWSEPGAAESATPAPSPKEPAVKGPEQSPTKERPVEGAMRTPVPTPSPTLSPTPSPFRLSTPTPSSSRTPIPVRTPTSSPTPSPTPTPMASPKSTQSILPSPTATPARLESATPSPFDEHRSLELAVPGASPTNAFGELPRPEQRPEAQPKAARSPMSLPTPRSPASSQGADLKHQRIAALKEHTDLVLVQVRDATGNFREIDRLDTVQALPPPVSTKVTALAAHAREFRSQVGDKVVAYECWAEIGAVEALILVDEITRDIAAKDVPRARSKLSGFLKTYFVPSAANQKPLWHYLSSAFALCDRLKNQAADRLKRAQSLESDGKKSEALREYREIYQIYPNPATAESIRQLEKESP